MKRLLVLALAMGLAVAGGWSCSKRGDNAESRTSNQSEAAPAQQQAVNPPPESAPPEQSPAVNPPAQNPPPAAAERQAQSPRRTRRETPRTEQRAQTPPPPAEPVVRMVEVPAGTEIPATLNQELSTAKDGVGAPFTMTVRENVVQNGVVVIPAGATVAGEIVRSQRAPRLGGKAEMTLEFKELTEPGGKTTKIYADPVPLEGKSSTKGDVEKVIGGTVGGAVLGGILGGGKGAVKGGVAGGAAGGVWAVATRGPDIVLDSGREFAVKLARGLQVQTTAPGGPNP
jgi:hypothetical protein